MEDGYSISKNTPDLKAKELEGNLTAKRGKATTKKEKLHGSEDASGASLTSPSKKATGGNELNIGEKSAAASTSMKPSSKISLEEWIGPSNATDIYMPRKESNVEPERSNNLKKGARQKIAGKLSWCFLLIYSLAKIIFILKPSSYLSIFLSRQYILCLHPCNIMCACCRT